MKLFSSLLRPFYPTSVFLLSVFICTTVHAQSLKGSEVFDQAALNGIRTEEGFRRCERFVTAWLAYADPISKLIPRNLDQDRDLWNAKDCGADNYPFMVLTSFFTHRERFDGLMKQMLRNEERLTSRVGALPDDYSFSKKDFLHPEINMGRIVFGSAEYIKDGLMPLTEWIGRSPWSERMLGILDELNRQIVVADDPEYSITVKTEVNGELLQVLSRVYWMTGDSKYLDWAEKIGDYFLLGEGYPLKAVEVMRLRDHGCELISGLCELYATLHFVNPEKKQRYQEPLYRLLDHILAFGRNEDGFFYNAYNSITGDVIDRGVSDSWGYNLNGYYTVFLVDGTEKYRDAILKIFGNLHKYRQFDWERGSADGYADAIESALNLYNRIPDERVADWIDSEIDVMWSMQDSSHRENAHKWVRSGVIEGWHGDGNFARTTIMYNLWKTKGVYTDHFIEGLKIGGEIQGNSLYLVLQAPEKKWRGKILFDKSRHKTVMNMPLDWPRINQFPEWYTVDPDRTYRLVDERGKILNVVKGASLIEGIEFQLKAGERKRLIISPL